jgi:hypothetical protein
MLESTAAEETTAEELGTVHGLLGGELREQMRKRMLQRYFEELPENEFTRRNIVAYIKVMIKNTQMKRLTCVEGESTQ